MKHSLLFYCASELKLINKLFILLLLINYHSTQSCICLLYFLFQTNMTNIAIIIMFRCNKLCVHTLLCNDVNIHNTLAATLAQATAHVIKLNKPKLQLIFCVRYCWERREIKKNVVQRCHGAPMRSG